MRSLRLACVLLAPLSIPLLFVGCTEPGPLNLLIVSVDTLRADALGFDGYGAARTPHLDRLAAEGTVFEAAFAPVPRTTPALGSLLTGLSPKHHGSRDVGDPIHESIPTLAEILAARGYRTLAVSTHDSAGPRQGLDRGFERFVDYRRIVEGWGEELYTDLSDLHASPDGRPGWAQATTDEALGLLAEAPRDQPYFLWMFYFDPHFLYRPPPPFGEVEAEGCWDLYHSYMDRRQDAGQVFYNVGGVAEAALADCRKLYDAEIAYVDQQIGRLLDTLRRDGRLDNTLILFVADHGENFGEGGLYFEHGDDVHDAALRVPLVFVGPGIAAGRRDDGAVTLADLLPTVLELLEIPLEERPSVDGTDLSSRLVSRAPRPSRDRDRVVFAESASAVWNEAVRNVTTGRAWRRVCINGPRFALCENPTQAPGVLSLYDHVADPELRRDVAAEYPETVARLLEARERWPPESARRRVARTTRFKLVHTPRLDGGYGAALYDLESDPAERVDVQELFPKVYRHLEDALARWVADLPPMPVREIDPELEESLRTLGYVP